MRVISASQHIGGDTLHNAQSVASLKPTSAGFTEQDFGGRTTLQALRKGLGDAYNLLYPPARAEGLHSQEVPVALRRERRNRLLGHTSEMLSPDLGAGIGNDRHMTIIRWERGLVIKRKMAHIQLHLNAAIQNMDTGEMYHNDRVHVTEVAVQKVEDRITLLKQAGYAVVISGDWNWRRVLRNGKIAQDWHYSPLNVAKRLNLHYVDDGLDWVLWTKNLYRVGKPQIFPPNTAFNHADHPWILVRLYFRPLRRSV